MYKKPALLILAGCISAVAYSQQKPNWDSLGKLAAATEVYTPVPPVVTPGATPADAPSDAIILFDGKNLDAWQSAAKPNGPAGWTVANGIITVNKSAGDIQTKQKFTDYQLHIEWRIPTNITGEGQARGNSGIFLAGDTAGNGYEVQVLDCYKNTTYTNGQTGSVYKQTVPLANACKKPGEWQVYDIIWTAPRFDPQGNLLMAARVTVIHNGVLLQNNTEVKGFTEWIGKPHYSKHGPAPIRLQSHGDPSEPISFRNIWLREL